jgi:glycosidase
VRRRHGSRSLRAVAALAGLAAAPAPPGPEPGPAPWRHDWARGAVFYEVFVRSFADSNGDGVGDLPGLTARLDYLNDGDPESGHDLGVAALWLMPIFESPSYHGYDVVDYERIDADYGTGEDFDRLLAAAHRRGLRVIVDFVLNHTGRDHPWFRDAAAAPRGARRDWYVWRLTNPGWTQPWGRGPVWHPSGGAFYYGIFWSGMPDLNFANPAVREEMKRLAAHWLERGVDGFRLDATRHLFAAGPGDAQNDRPETHAFLREFAAFVRSVKPEAVLVGENWTGTRAIAPYFAALPMNFNFPLAEAIIAALRAGAAAPVRRVLEEMAAAYPRDALDAPFLTNHDQDRLATQLDHHPGRLRLAAAILLTLPGAPFLYYGEEVGLGNGQADGDPAKRTPMPWDASGAGFSSGRPWIAFAPGRESANAAAHSADPHSLLAHYRSWIRLRASSEALRSGDLALLPAAPSLLAWVRAPGTRARALVVHNLGPQPATAGPWQLAAAAPRRLGGHGAITLGPDGLRVDLPELASAVFALD